MAALAAPMEADAPSVETPKLVPCRAKAMNKPRCNKPATHDIMLSCLTCGYNETRPLCARHAAKAEAMKWWCGVCKQALLHFVTGR